MKQTYYYISKGNRKLPGLSLEQLEDIYNLTGLFLQKENEPLRGLEELGIPRNLRIEKTIVMEKNAAPYVSYSISTAESDISGLSPEQVREIYDTIPLLLKEYPDSQEKSTEKENSSIEISGYQEIKAENPILQTDVYIEKCMVYDKSKQDTATQYIIFANEYCLDGCTRHQLEEFRLSLREFLKQNRIPKPPLHKNEL